MHYQMLTMSHHVAISRTSLPQVQEFLVELSPCLGQISSLVDKEGGANMLIRAMQYMRLEVFSQLTTRIVLNLRALF